MITNEKQYKITKAEAKRFREALDSFDVQIRIKEGIHPKIIQAQQDALKSQLSVFEKDIEQYERLKEGKETIAEFSSFNDLPAILIKARIAKGLTQAELGAMVGIKEQQIQRYEADEYSSANLKRLTEIAAALSIKLHGGSELLTTNVKNAPEFDIDWNAFPITEMYKRGWFEDFKGSLQDIKNNAEEALEHFFFEQAKLSQDNLCLYKKNVRLRSRLNDAALYAWQARVLIKAQKKREKFKSAIPEFRKKEITEEWIQSLLNLSRNIEDITKVEEFLAQKGIIFIIEPHLQGTHLDGAAMLLVRDFPVIAMTLRYDRIDNFWFVLLHELGHIKLHLDKSDEMNVIFDEFDESVTSLTPEEEKREKEADAFALNSLIPEKVWKTSPVRFSLSKAAVEKQAEKWGIHPAIVAGKLRKETNNWTLFNDLIGANQVRKRFEKEFSL
jgi:HTH-type transcriptional regulator/antitoxin HigA